MKITIQSQNYVATMEMVGQFWEKHDIQRFLSEVDSLPGQDIRLLVLNLERLTFINSLGLGAIVRIFTMLRDANCALVLYKPSGGVKETIDISGFDSIMTVLDSKQELDSFLVGFPH